MGEMDGNVEMILGTAQLCTRYGLLQESVELSGDDPTAFLRAAIDLGFTAIDTAPSYGEAEDRIRESGIFAAVHTKLPARQPPRESLEASLRRLGRETVEVAYLHDPNAPVTDSGAAVAEARRGIEGLAGALGVSVYEREAAIASCLRDDIDVVQLPVNPLCPSIIDAVTGLNTAPTVILGRSLLAQGLLLRPAEHLPRAVGILAPAIDAFHLACREIERPPLEAALLWARQHPGLDGLVLGAASTEQLLQLVQVLASTPLTGDELESLARVDVPHVRHLDPRLWQ